MTPHTQAFLHDPATGIRGDCYRTAIACLLDVPRDDVPHVFEHDTPAIQRATGAYLRRFGLAMLEMPLKGADAADVVAFMAGTNPDIPSFLLSGTTPRGWDHTVVVHDGEVWDPHPSRSGLTGPCDDGFWWVGALAKATTGRPAAAIAEPLPVPGDPS